MENKIIHIKNIEDYQPNYKDGRNLIWIRWDINTISNYKISKLSPSQRWLFISLICLETKAKKPIVFDIDWIAKAADYPKKDILNDIKVLQEIELIVTKCDIMSQNVPTDRHTNKHTYKHTNKHTDKVSEFDFESIWAKYPNKDGKKAADRHFKASVKTEKDWQDINQALKNYLDSEVVKKGFIKNGSTWFNNWRDWIQPPIKPVNPVPRSEERIFK